MTTREDILSLAKPMIVETVDDGYWAVNLLYGRGDASRDASRAMADWLRAAPTPPAAEAPGQEPDTWAMMDKLGLSKTFETYSAKLGWGLTPYQPECWAALDLAIDELVRRRKDGMTAKAPGQEPVAYLGRGLLEDLNKPGVEYLNCCAYTKAGIWMLDEDQRVPVYTAPPTYADAEAKEFARGIEAAAKDTELAASEFDALSDIRRVLVFRAKRIRSLASPAPKGEA